VATVGDAMQEESAEEARKVDEAWPWIRFVVGLDDTLFPRRPAPVPSESSEADETEQNKTQETAVDSVFRSSAGRRTGTGTGPSLAADESGPSEAGLKAPRGLAADLAVARSAMLVASGLYHVACVRDRSENDRSQSFTLCTSEPEA
jgi:hypothetical protein